MAEYYYSDGSVSDLYYPHKALHRADGPAAVENGYRSWWIHGKHHRLDGPASDYGNGSFRWCINGDELTEAEFEAHPERLKYLFTQELERILNE